MDPVTAFNKVKESYIDYHATRQNEKDLPLN